MKSDWEENWPVEAGVVALVALIFGFGWWNSGLVGWNLAGFAIAVALYAFALRIFGHRSSIEVGFACLLAAMLMALLMATFHRAQENQLKHIQRQQKQTPIFQIKP